MIPVIIDIAGRHFRERPRGVDVLVVHAMGEWVKDGEGVFHHCTDWLDLSGLSVHAFCLPDGRIVQSVDPAMVAYHAGKDNNRSIGMEFLVSGGHSLESLHRRMANVEDPPYTAAQYESGGWWFRRQAERFGLGFQHIKGHVDLDPARKQDPGAAFDWDAFRAAFETAG